MGDSITYVIGMDLSDEKADFYAAQMVDGTLWKRGRVPLTQPALTRLLGDLPRSWVVLETGTHCRWIAELIAALGHQVTVCNARELRFIFCGRNKTDELDAKALCDVALLRPALLYPVELRDAATQHHLTVVRCRAAAVRAHSLLVNTVRGLAKTLGHRVRKCGTEKLTYWTRVDVPQEALEILEPTLEALDGLSAAIERYDERMAELSETEYPETAVLRQVYGVGPVASLSYILTLFDRNRFKKNRDAGPYLGLTPSLTQSGKRKRENGISKEGNTYMRQLLTQCAQTILRKNAPDSDLRRHGMAIWKRGGKQDKGAKRRAVTAVARKLAVLMCALWKTAEVYEPLRNSKAA